MPKSYRKRTLPKADKNGDVRPEKCGYRFTVGNVRSDGETEMLRRLDAITGLYDKQCEYLKIDRWADWVLPWAKKIAAGEKLNWAVSDLAKRNEGQAAEEASLLHELRNMGLELSTDEPDAILQGEARIKQWLDARIRTAVDEAVQRTLADLRLPEGLADRLGSAGPEDPATAEARRLTEAIRAYVKHVKVTGKRQDDGRLAPSPRNYIRNAKLLENWLKDGKVDGSEDCALWELDRDRLDVMFAYWRNRPISEQTGERISYVYAKHICDCLWSICDWLDGSERWKWSFPKGANKIVRTPIRLDADRKKARSRRISQSIYTPDQLATIASELDQFGKLILGVSVNCAMQPAEVGRLEVGDYFQAHPETDEEADWIIFDRPKTGEYGEWVLWPEVASLVRWGTERAERIGVERLIVSSKGTPWYREDWSNPETRFSKWWQAKPTEKSHHIGVVTRLANERADFPRHTIKFLRKILPSLVRPKDGREIADLINARKVDNSGRTGGRDTDRYSDRLYQEAAQAIRELEQHFRPFLDALRS